MKKILCGAVAAVALVGTVSPALAQTAQRHYAGLPIVGTATNPSNTRPVWFLPSAQEAADGAVAFGFGTRYTAYADAPSDSETATPQVDVVFNLSGSVNKDCSFYSGNNSNARNIDFGVIGVRTGNNENVNSAFEMVGPATASIESLTAGCNFNNEVEIAKDDVKGLVNSAAGGYDTNEFQANIPYTVNASWTGVAVNSVASGSAQSLNVGSNDLSKTKQQGAWRSAMNIAITAPVVNKGLVAGTYSGTTTLTLRAL